MYIWSPVPVTPSSGKIFQIDSTDHPVQRVCEQCLLSWDETPQRSFQLQRHQQTCVVCTDHLNTVINSGGARLTPCYYKWEANYCGFLYRHEKASHLWVFQFVCTCRSSSREPPRFISPSGMSGWRLHRKPWISVQMSRARDWALWTSCGARAALVW